MSDKRLIFDIETDGLTPTKIWCLVAKDIDSSDEYLYGPEQIEDGLDLLEGSDYLAGHNIIGFDLPVIKKLTGRDLSKDRKIVDTLVLSRLLNPVREGNHTLQSWGSRLGFQKIDFNDYARYSNEMLEYCLRDVQLNLSVYNSLRKEAKGFATESVELEHDVYDILTEQREKGFLFDIQGAELLLAELREKMSSAKYKVHKVFRPKISEIKLFPQRTKTGNLAKTAKTLDGVGVRLTPEEYDKLQAQLDKAPNFAACEHISRFEVTEFNLGSRVQIGEYLQEFGWKPKQFTESGRPKVDETVLLNIKGIPEAELIAEYLLVQKRIAQISDWLEKTEDDGRVHGGVRTNGTITGRMSHQFPNMAQVPNMGSLYGEECRKLWIVPDKYKLVGIDASQLELRMLAHYMQDEGYTNDILNGDIHTTNQELAGLESRDQAKTFIYALIYGAGNGKLGSVVGGNTSDGKELRRRFLDNLPSFDTLRNRVSFAAGRGFLKGLDGRKIFIRSEHAALNTLLQSAGAIVMKQALVIFDEVLKSSTPIQPETGSFGPQMLYDARFVANVHDEWQLEVAHSDCIRVGQEGVNAIVKAGTVLNLRCPLDAQYKIGNNWSETH